MTQTQTRGPRLSPEAVRSPDVIAGVGQTRRNRQEVVKICTSSKAASMRARLLCARRCIVKAFAPQDFRDSCFGLIQDAARPAETKKFRLR